MLDRFLRGLSIADASFKVLGFHPQLIVFPLISMTALGALLLTVGRAIVEVHKTEPVDALQIAACVAFYMIVTFIAVFFNAALVACVRDAFARKKVSLSAGLKDAVAHLPQIVSWTVFTATVGLVLAMLRGALRKLGIVGALVGGAAEFSWTMMTYMAVPVLVMENLGPWQCLERCAELIKGNWGKAVGVETGIGVLYGLALIPGLLAVVYAGMGYIPVVLVVAASAIYLPIVLGGLAAVDMIFRTGVYVYAATGEMPLAMDKELVQGAFR
jgi:hypothetical protein